MPVAFNEDYHRHILDTRVDQKGVALCGKRVFGWAYCDVDHAYISTTRDAIQPCPDCAKKVIDVFNGAQ